MPPHVLGPGGISHLCILWKKSVAEEGETPPPRESEGPLLRRRAFDRLCLPPMKQRVTRINAALLAAAAKQQVQQRGGIRTGGLGLWCMETTPVHTEETPPGALWFHYGTITAH